MRNLPEWLLPRSVPYIPGNTVSFLGNKRIQETHWEFSSSWLIPLVDLMISCELVNQYVSYSLPRRRQFGKQLSVFYIWDVTDHQSKKRKKKFHAHILYIYVFIHTCACVGVYAHMHRSTCVSVHMYPSIYTEFMNITRNQYMLFNLSLW